MPQLMPKHIEKGPMARSIEAAFDCAFVRAQTLVRARSWLEGFWRGESVGSLADVLPGLTEAEREHLRTDWFGDASQAFWVSGLAAETNLGQLASRVLGVGLIEALEVSLGLGSGEPLDRYVAALAKSAGIRAAAVAAALELDPAVLQHDQAALKRDLPVDIYWLCDMPLFESYVSWNDRQVTVIIATWAVDSPMFALLPRAALQEQAKTSWQHGMLVVQSGAPDDPAALTATTALLDRRAARWTAARSPAGQS